MVGRMGVSSADDFPFCTPVKEKCPGIVKSWFTVLLSTMCLHFTFFKIRMCQPCVFDGRAGTETKRKNFLLTKCKLGSQVPRKDPRGCSQYLLPPALIPALPHGLPPGRASILLHFRYTFVILQKAGYYNRFRYFLTGSVIMSRLSLLHPPAVVAPAPVALALPPFVWV